MELVHYSRTPLTDIHSTEQHERLGLYGKPSGLWVSVVGEYDWMSWCKSEMPDWVDGVQATRVHLDPAANILQITGASEHDGFSHEFGEWLQWHPKHGDWCINWRRVSERYSGIIIAPYIWERRLDHPPGTGNWYYTWDCASGCIWDAAAIARLEPLVAEAGANA